MKYTIEIPKPCSENWEQMTSSERGRFCNSCKKEVVDFRNYSNSELAKFVHNNNKECGIFLVSQLNSELILPKTKTKFPLRLFLGISAIISGATVFAQENKSAIEKIQDAQVSTVEKDFVEISGTVSDDQGLLPGANITQKGQKNGIQSDENGFFTIQIPKIDFNKKVYLTFQFIGYEDEILEVFQNSNNLKIKFKSNPQSFEGVVMTGGYVAKKKSFFRRLFTRKKTSH